MCNPYFHCITRSIADGQKRVVLIRSAVVIHSLGLQFLQFAWVCTNRISDNITIYIFHGTLSQECIDLCCIRLHKGWRKPGGEFYIFPADIWKTGLYDFTSNPVQPSAISLGKSLRNYKFLSLFLTVKNSFQIPWGKELVCSSHLSHKEDVERHRWKKGRRWLQFTLWVKYHSLSVPDWSSIQWRFVH